SELARQLAEKATLRSGFFAFVFAFSIRSGVLRVVYSGVINKRRQHRYPSIAVHPTHQEGVMEKHDLQLVDPHPTLHNADLEPLTRSKRVWGWFEIFNVWTNDIQSLFGYTLAATLFI